MCKTFPFSRAYTILIRTGNFPVFQRGLDKNGTQTGTQTFSLYVQPNIVECGSGYYFLKTNTRKKVIIIYKNLLTSKSFIGITQKPFGLPFSVNEVKYNISLLNTISRKENKWVNAIKYLTQRTRKYMYMYDTPSMISLRDTTHIYNKVRVMKT